MYEIMRFLVGSGWLAMILAAVIANVYLYGKEVVKTDKPVRFTLVCVSAITALVLFLILR